LRENNRIRTVTLPATAGEAIAWLHANGEVVGRRSQGLKTEYEVRLSDADWARFRTHHFGA
jgi:GTPase